VVTSSELVSLRICDAWNGENQVKNGRVMQTYQNVSPMSHHNTYVLNKMPKVQETSSSVPFGRL
jgi:hypothetical protein